MASAFGVWTSGLQFVIEMNQWTWDHFKDALKDVTREEIDWRPLPQANSINLIPRHLRIEAQWQLRSIEHGEPMPAQITASLQQLIDSVTVDFERNLEELEAFYTRFVAALRRTTMSALSQQSVLAYQEFRVGDFYVPRIC